ncbi:hypothetical protein BKA65DRAFT_475627 [Rhexocercosporidium sp. MPI-PUGE-AT-0058]|nr:hypothetical protein BKA65DRAFT_475627 [Rhexocercosporidium sp. MPI-PUGE-AT-0058]
MQTSISTKSISPTNPPHQNTASNPVPPPRANPTGHYTIKTNPDINPPLNTTSFTLTLFYTASPSTSPPKDQLHATFKFGTLTGRMRLCPFSSYPRGKKFTITEFEKACHLERDSMPCPERCNWLMRWRGRDGGMRQEKRVGGEENVQGVFDFVFKGRGDEGKVEGEGKGEGEVGVRFAMMYRGKVFGFEGTKVKELGEGEGRMDWEDVEARWDSLQDWLGRDSDDEAEKLLDELKVLPGGEVSLELAHTYLTTGPNQWKHLVDSSDSE